MQRPRRHVTCKIIPQTKQMKYPISDSKMIPLGAAHTDSTWLICGSTPGPRYDDGDDNDDDDSMIINLTELYCLEDITECKNLNLNVKQ